MTKDIGALGIRYITDKITAGEPLEIVPGILLLRLSIPFALDHINVYLLKENDGWTLIDCGINTPITQTDWNMALDSRFLRGSRITKIVVTHHHPDHVGLAGWIANKFDAPLLMSKGEFEVADRYSNPIRDVVLERIQFWQEHGLPHELRNEVMDNMPRYTKNVVPLPKNIELIDTNAPIEMGGRLWTIITGRGHSPEHLSFFNARDDILISGDQILPKITPNISVWPNGDQNPLNSYLTSIQQFSSLGKDPIILPSHKIPMRGLKVRVSELCAHHKLKLAILLDALHTSKNCYEILPALFNRNLNLAELSFGLGEGVAHLNYLVATGLATTELNQDGCTTYKAK